MISQRPPSREAFGSYAQAFAAAEAHAASQLVAERFHCGDGRIELRAIGRNLGRLLARPLVPAPFEAPRRWAASLPRLRVDVWEGATWAGDPALTCAADEQGVRYGTSGEQFARSMCGRYLRYTGHGFAFWFDRHASHIVGRCDSAERFTLWNRNRPLQPLVNAWLLDTGAVSVHAAMVGNQGRGVLLPGPTGSGKSTCAISALEASLDFLGDDFCSVSLKSTGIDGTGVYTTMKVTGETLAQRPHLAHRAEPNGAPSDNAWLLYVAEVEPERVVASTRLVALAFPELSSSRPSRVVPLPEGRALLALMPCLLPVEPGQLRRTFAAARRLVQGLPAFRLIVGRSTSDLGDALRGLCAVSQ